MAQVWIPPLLRSLTGGQDQTSAQGSDVGDVIADLETRFPGLRARLCDGDSLRPGLAAVVDGQVARRGLLEPVGPGSEVHFIPAIGGG